MKICPMNYANLIRTLVILLLGALYSLVSLAAEPPAVGSKAADFTLKSLDDKTINLNTLTAKGKVVLVVLRGWPGYQCPLCDRQAHDFIAARAEFAKAGAQLLFIYPGPAQDLIAHANEFKTAKGREWPAEYLYVLDPEYSMVNTYGLRWNVDGETAYPSTFVLDQQGVVRFAKISKTHGDRSKAADILKALNTLK